ncbi:leucine-rich repeat flightless-interacting protein 2-like [Ictalurus furcatus]|uniref:leucine-rich repeat flightless-interacting protein 2-like n=1 Tax=Ictalurus furcatus TaxID=66913 RepID=UPI00234FBCD1|nr:leucine-rich repeat flightless-interacting protein 2-like [Ictalurus furcatus]XP_053469129.1 leucine-rich repeat flightless-interacting protein 2-like [Ictalurus furcatus]
MQHLMSLARSRAAGLPLRPLLYAVGAAATAAGVYYYFKKRGDGDGERTADTTLTEGPVQTQLPAVDDSLLDPGLMSEVDGVSVTQTDSTVPQESLSEAEEKKQKVEVSSALVDSERSNLEDRVRELEELLCEEHRECERKTKDYEAECQAHGALNSQYSEIKETLTHIEGLVKVTLTEAEEKYKRAMESEAELENEKLDLMSQVNTLRGSVKQLEEQFSETRRRNDEITRELGIGQGILTFEKSKAEEQVKDLKQKISSLKVSLDEAEVRYAESLESITELENENYDLVDDMNTLQEAVDDLEEQLSQTQTRCNEATTETERKTQELRDLRSKWELLNETVLKDYETERVAHFALKLQYNELMERHNQLLNDTLAEAVAKCEQAIFLPAESNAQLESEKSDWKYHVHKMEGAVQKLEKLLDEVEISCDVIKQDREREREAYNILKSQYEEALNSVMNF